MPGHTFRGHGLPLPLDLGGKARYHGGERMKEPSHLLAVRKQREERRQQGLFLLQGIPSVA